MGPSGPWTPITHVRLGAGHGCVRLQPADAGHDHHVFDTVAAGPLYDTVAAGPLFDTVAAGPLNRSMATVRDV